jgi:hypothetical protein
MGKHIHADLMAEYAKDAAESMTPWDKWEVLDIAEAGWRPLLTHPTWHSLNQYRRIEDFTKVLINGVQHEFRKPTPVWGRNKHLVTGTGLILDVYTTEYVANLHATFEHKDDAENYAKAIRAIVGKS